MRSPFRYEYTEQKKQIILQIRNNLTEITIDQLPVLADLRVRCVVKHCLADLSNLPFCAIALFR